MDMLVQQLDTYSRLGIPKFYHQVPLEDDNEVEEGESFLKVSLSFSFF